MTVTRPKPKPFSSTTVATSKCFPDRQTVPQNTKETWEGLFCKTQARTAAIRREGFKVVDGWACEGRRVWPKPKTFTKPYHQAILYDFEAFGDKNHLKEPSGDLTFERTHVPISVSIGDTLDSEPTHICERELKKLCCKFMDELERRGQNIRQAVRREFIPKNVYLLPKKPPKATINEWCD